jgi:asparagine N-glycosylation enzyme membrane subunit Stt3
MSGAGYVIAWIVCVIVGAVAGVLLGWLLWELGLELIGSAVVLVGGILGGFSPSWASYDGPKGATTEARELMERCTS